MTAPLQHRRFTIEYVEPSPFEKFADDIIVAESTFLARCMDCGATVRAKVDWRSLRGLIDDLVITSAFGSKLDRHAATCSRIPSH